jgi:hypothetical protein
MKALGQRARLRFRCRYRFSRQRGKGWVKVMGQI